MRRTNAGYFGFCNSHHLPDVTDLVIIELDTDDPPCVYIFVYDRPERTDFISQRSGNDGKL